MERKRTITLFDFQCQDSIFHEGLVGIMRGEGAEGNIQIVCACLCCWTFSCWTRFIKNKSTPVFLTPLSSLILKGNKTIQFIPLIQNPFLIHTSKYFPNLYLLLLTFYEEKIISDKIYVSLANLKSAFTC